MNQSDRPIETGAVPGRLAALVAALPVWGSVALIAAAGLVLYSPVLAAGFWTDDYTFVEMAARLPFLQYLRQYFDPRDLISWYRPLQGMLWWIEFKLFGADPTGYHVVNVLIHIGNCFLLFGLVRHVTRKWWVGLTAALAFLAIFNVGIDVYWPGVADPEMTFFCLAALWFWLAYLDRPAWPLFAGAFVAYVAAILTKEMAATLLVVMFLADRLMLGRPVTWKALVLRYMPFAIVMVPYALIEYGIQTRGVYVNFVTYGTGGHPLQNLGQYLLWLTLPWSTGTPANVLALAVVVLALVYFVGVKRSRSLAFLALAGAVSVLPVVPFPFAIERYLYLPAAASAVWLAAALEWVRTRIDYHFVRVAALPALAAALFVWNGAGFFDNAFNYSEFVRETRLQFRPIFQKHPSFGPDTLLYFVEPPFPTPNLSGMLYLRYGDNVSVYGTDRDHVPLLHEHAASYVFYQDDQGTWQEQLVDKTVSIHSTQTPPVRFRQSISLVDFDLIDPKVTPGAPVILILYWQSQQKVDKDYTVFVHLVDAQGRVVAGYDGEPRQGKAPTSSWRPSDLLADAHLLSIADGVPPGRYSVELGLYDAATMQRLSVVDPQGNPITDKVVISPIIVEDRVAQ